MLVSGQSKKSKMRFVFADATQAARDLASNHLAGPAASQALAEGLAAVSLLGADLGTPQEAVTLRLETNGPIATLLVEATFEGTLRGYTGKKILNDFDGLPEQDMDAVFGTEGTCGVMVSLPGRMLSQSTTRVAPPRPARAVENYYAIAAQRSVAVAVSVRGGGKGIASARGFLVELMPGADAAEFARLSGEMSAPGFAARLDAAEGAAALLDSLNFGEVPERDERELRFACRCSREKAIATLQALPPEERAELVARGKPIDIYCHMCGKCHTVRPEEC